MTSSESNATAPSENRTWLASFLSVLLCHADSRFSCAPSLCHDDETTLADVPSDPMVVLQDIGDLDDASLRRTSKESEPSWKQTAGPSELSAAGTEEFQETLDAAEETLEAEKSDISAPLEGTDAGQDSREPSLEPSSPRPVALGQAAAVDALTSVAPVSAASRRGDGERAKSKGKKTTQKEAAAKSAPQVRQSAAGSSVPSAPAKIGRSATTSSLDSYSESCTGTTSSTPSVPITRTGKRTSTLNSQISLFSRQSSLPSVLEEDSCNGGFVRRPSVSGSSVSGSDPLENNKGRVLGGVLRMFSRSNDEKAPENAVIIFDWDDTLCPTTWALRLIQQAKNESELAKIEETYSAELEEHVAAVEQLLRTARAVARVAIVTLATPDFFERSAESFLEGLRAKELLSELGIQVYYAVRPSKTNDGKKPETAAKKKAMGKCLANLYPAVSARSVRWNVISIGDSAVEQEALKQLLSKRSGSSPLCKTLKFTPEPSLEQLTRQVQTITPYLADMVAYGKDFDRNSSRPWSPQS